MQIVNKWVASAALIGAAALAGCAGGGGFLEGLNSARGETGVSQFNVETEMIPDAVLVREDTVPDWPLGRFAFKPGADRLLVVTRIGSFAAKDDEGNPLPGRAETVERVWITLPASAALGTVLDVEDLEAKFLVGYDIREADSKKFFIQPCGIKGKVRILQENAGTAMVEVRMTVAPTKWKGTYWEFKKVAEVPMTTVGIHASRLPADAPENTFHAKPSQPAVTVNPTPGAGSGTDAALAAAQTQPSGGSLAAAAKQPTSRPAEHTLVGHWIVSRTASHEFEYRFQFDADGTFVFTSQRPTYPPVPRYGTYEIKNNMVVLAIDRAEPGILKRPFLTLKLNWSGDTPILQGDLGPDDYMANRRVLLGPGNFVDMNRMLPPTE